MQFTPEQRQRISDDAAGRTVESLEWEDDGKDGYWVMTFTGGAEISFRFMAELVPH